MAQRRFSGLGLKVVAEGVECDAQQAFLAANHCTAFQGYQFSQALPADEFKALAQQLQAASSSSLI